MVQRPRKVKTMNAVWEKLMAYATTNPRREKIIADEFNTMLDTLLQDDFFGTEGQRDPRGDHRDA